MTLYLREFLFNVSKGFSFCTVKLGNVLLTKMEQRCIYCWIFLSIDILNEIYVQFLYEMKEFG